MVDTLLHRLAAFVLRAGIRLVPNQTREWGNAMLAEIHHIEGNWAVVVWALGGVGVLAKQALIGLLLPAGDRQAAPIGNPLSGEAKMHKVSLRAGGVCLAAVLLFFLAPVFRQAFRVSLAQWHNVIHVDPGLWVRQPELESLARRVEKNHDAEGVAFVAARLHDGAESVRLADEAVRLDPKLIWILGVVGARHSAAPQVPGWVARLERWDPGNALPYLILAQRNDLIRGAGGSFMHPPAPRIAWEQAMASAFQSTRIDDYVDRLRDIDRIVARRYDLSDPTLVVFEEELFVDHLPTYTASDSLRYARSAISAGDALEVRGDTKGAIEKYLMVAHFVSMFESQQHVPDPPFFDTLMPNVYQRLAAVYRKMDNGPQSAYFAGLAATAEQDIKQHGLQWHSEIENQRSISGVTPWNALVVEISDAAMLASALLLLISLLVVLARSRSFKPRKLRMGPVATGVRLLAAVGLLVSSVTLYVVYRPYAAIYTRFLETGDTSQLKILRDFVELTRSPIGTQIYRFRPTPQGPAMVGPYISVHNFIFYFWLAVTVLGLASLAVIAGLHLLKCFRPRAGAAANGSMVVS
ncbi:MAG: hypothetical protein EPN47_12765 [Acidobacteria bacterium]|nr:MAG: hypothetical protein EPN47_12765 [Acidobacteriota bacterium]